MHAITAAARSSEIHLAELIVPEHASHDGALHGIAALQLMGKAAFVCASRFASCSVAMAKADSIDILEPVQLGEIVDIRAKVVFHGQSSMTILVDVASGDSVTRQAPPRMRGRFMMVAVDAGGLPIPIPDGTDQFRKQEMPL